MPNKWFATGLAFFLHPLAFVYLARLRWAALYFLLVVAFGIMDLLLLKNTGYYGLMLVLSITCATHAFRLAQSVDFGEGRKWYNCWRGVSLVFLIFVTTVFVLRSFLYEPFHISSTSMTPTLKPGEHIVISKWGYGLYGSYGIELWHTETGERKQPKRGEVFAFYPPHNRRVFVSRVIGIPGDNIDYFNKQLSINEEAIATQPTNTANHYHETLNGTSYVVQYLNDSSPYRNFKIKVPKNAYFVMGDNRDNSADSRIWGLVSAENIIGKAALVW